MCLRLQNAYLKTGIKVANCQMRKSLAQLTESPLLEKNLKNVTATCQPLLVYQRCMLSTHTGAASVIKSPYPDVVVPKVNLTHYVMNSFKGFLGNTCMVGICNGKYRTHDNGSSLPLSCYHNSHTRVSLILDVIDVRQ